MRFGTWREAPLVLGLAALLGLSLCATATTEAGGWPFHTTLPREVPAYDFNTGGEYFAPPVPYGHYAKDPRGHLAKTAGLLKGCLLHGPGCAGHHGLGGHGLGHGPGCGDGCGHGLGGHGLGKGLGCGHGLGDGCGFCSGKGLFGKHHGAGAGLGHGPSGVICDPNAGRVKNFGPYHPTGAVASGQIIPSAQAVASPQAVAMPTGQMLCGGPGACGLKGCGHGGLLGKLRCKLCGGNGIGHGGGGPCGGCGGMGIGDPCSSCGGNGCGKCGGCGLLSRLGQCPFCHGAGCGHCLKGLGSKLHGLLASPMGMIHRPKYKWFVGAGGPVPLTPGYVPYIVTTRSPRDFFAFPPKNPDAF